MCVHRRVALNQLKIIDAVQSAHGRLIVHRDLKPANILVARSEPKLLDFGIAKLMMDAPTTEHAVTGMTPLTPEYASPEQVRSRPIAITQRLRLRARRYACL